MGNADRILAEELVLNLYNNTHENKIELEKVKDFYFDDGEATIIMYSDDPDAVCGEDRVYVKTTLTKKQEKSIIKSNIIVLLSWQFKQFTIIMYLYIVGYPFKKYTAFKRFITHTDIY